MSVHDPPAAASGNGPAPFLQAPVLQAPFLQMDEVALRYGGAQSTLALAATTLSVTRGEFGAVIGTAGWGRSCLMKRARWLWVSNSVGRLALLCG